MCPRVWMSDGNQTSCLSQGPNTPKCLSGNSITWPLLTDTSSIPEAGLDGCSFSIKAHLMTKESLKVTDEKQDRGCHSII